MNKIYQTRHKEGTKRGNCMQAAIASLLELPLHQVPDFILFDDPLDKLIEFVKQKGYSYEGHIGWHDDNINEIINHKGINGLFYAVVYSPSHYDIDSKEVFTHAVICDKEFNIVHDPNPAYKKIYKYPEFDRIGNNGIVKVYLIN